MNRLPLTGLIVLLVGVLLAGPAAAQEYPPTFEGVAISSPNVVAGGSFTVSGEGWLAGSEVELELRSDPVSLGTAKVNAEGSFSTGVTIPSSVPAGDHTLVVTGIDANGEPRVEQLAVVVAASSGGDPLASADDTSSDGLAYTGMDFTLGTAALIALLTAGAVAFGIGRRRSAKSSA